MATTTELPAMPVSHDELHDIQLALESGDLTLLLQYHLEGVLATLNQFDSEPDPERREDRNLDHALNWRVARQRWRRFVAAWREEHPLPGQAAS